MPRSTWTGVSRPECVRREYMALVSLQTKQSGSGADVSGFHIRLYLLPRQVFGPAQSIPCDAAFVQLL